jgi:hypothetical protein
MPSKLSYRPPEPIALPPLLYTSLLQIPPLSTSLFLLILIPSSAVPVLHDAIYEGERSFSMEDPNAVHGDSEVRDV